jgi:hypothetical protein
MSVIQATTSGIKDLADGTLRISFDIDPRFAQEAYKLFGARGSSVAIAALSLQATTDLAQAETIQSANDFGKYAEALYKCGWFLNPKVNEALGTDAEFLDYVKSRPCCYDGYASCDGDVVAAHVRRIADGAGTSIKPKYSAIPLCNNHHQLQHQQGESALGGKDWCDKQRAKYLTDWCKEQIYVIFEVDSLAQLNKNNFVSWCDDIGIYNTLPLALKG